MKKIIPCTLILVCIVAVSLTAQTQEEKSDIEVIVTASRVEEPAEETPAYVSVITAAELSASGQTTLVDALENLAGIHFRSFSGNAAQAEITMRGFGDNSHSRVLVLLDGRRLNRPDMASINWLEIPVESIERVEIVRGGASVLFGDNAVAGVINIITRKQAADGFGFQVSAQYGSFNQNQERAEVSGSVGPVSITANAEHSATDGFRERSAYRSMGGGVRAGLDLDAFSSSLALSYSRLYYQLPGELTLSQFEADPTQSLYPADESNNQYLNADLALALGPGDRWLMDGNLSYGMKFIESDVTSWSSFSDLLLNTMAVTPKLRADMDLLAGNRLILGIDGYLDRLNLKTYSDVARSSLDLENVVTKATLGAYLTDELSILPMFTLSGGLRYELARIAVRTITGTPIDEADLLQNLAYQIGLFVSPGAGSRFWTKYGTVFRYPAVDEIANLYDSPFISSPFNTDLQPEKGYNLELGGEVELFRLLKLSTNLFWLEMQDEIAYDGVALLNVNLDETRHLGVESGLGLQFARMLELAASYSYTAATFRAGPNSGKRIPLVPVHRGSAEAVLHLPLDLSFGASGRYVGDVYSGGDYENKLAKLDAYWLLDLFIRYNPEYLPGNFEIYFGVDNVLDAVYASTGYGFDPDVYYYPGAGRSWKIGGSYGY
ncbi:MAG: TonB-dependent receptor [Spirochaetaceae bacterium]|nr:MAG: TonB-dependent receptor [Spirochaetaceae bacterium]